MKFPNALIPLVMLTIQSFGASEQSGMIPPLPPSQLRTVLSLSSAMKVLKGEKVERNDDVFLLDDNSKVLVVGPFSKHDAYILFCHLGCKAAVPLMIKDLAEYEEAAKARRDMPCTSGHLKFALIAQTGQDFGYDRGAWQKWWDNEGKDLPDDFFDPDLRKEKPTTQAVRQ